MTQKGSKVARYTTPLRASDNPGVRGYLNHCQMCGRLFFASRPDALYDTNACRQRAYRRRRAFERQARAFAARLSQMRQESVGKNG